MEEIRVIDTELEEVCQELGRIFRNQAEKAESVEEQILFTGRALGVSDVFKWIVQLKGEVDAG
jgi:hypothetical protein